MKKRGLRSASIHRRTFFRMSAGAAAGWTLSACGQPGRPWKVLSVAEADLLTAVADQIIPRDEQAGAGEAGFANFIDRQLQAYYRELRNRYRAGLQSLEASSASLTGRSFLDLDPEERKSVLETLEKNAVPEGIWTSESSGEFFSLLVDHTMQSYYGPPRHGGNQGYSGFRTVDLDYPQILPRAKGPVV